MLAIRTVVCPVDFSPATGRQLDLAIDVCRAFGARLVLHHNVTDVSPGAGVSWMWHADHVATASTTTDDRLRAIMRAVPAGIDVETCITRGAATEGVLRVSDAAEADVIVLSAHAGKTEDHASVIEFLLDHSNRGILALHDPGEDVVLPRFAVDHYMLQTVLVPVNLRTEAHPQLDFAFELARAVPLRLDLLHVIDQQSTKGEHADDTAELRRHLATLAPADLAPRISSHVETGDASGTIADAAKRLGASLIVMGEHSRVPVKRWFGRDNSRAVLHQAHCPVWYVPAIGVPALALGRFAISDKKSILWGNV
jgi:nucleotide-binding universal stress UspA family protein